MCGCTLAAAGEPGPTQACVTNEVTHVFGTRALGASLDLTHLRERGIEASLIGPLKSGDFGFHSDIDILVTECPAHLICAVEAGLEDIMGGISFDLVYLSLFAEEKRARWLSHAH